MFLSEQQVFNKIDSASVDCCQQYMRMGNWLCFAAQCRAYAYSLSVCSTISSSTEQLNTSSFIMFLQSFALNITRNVFSLFVGKPEQFIRYLYTGLNVLSLSSSLFVLQSGIQRQDLSNSQQTAHHLLQVERSQQRFPIRAVVS